MFGAGKSQLVGEGQAGQAGANGLVGPLNSALVPTWGWSLVALSQSPGKERALGLLRTCPTFLGNAGDSATLAQGLLLNQGSNSPFPPAPASGATSNTCPHGEGQAQHCPPFLGEERGGKNAKEAFSSPQRRVQTQRSPFRKEALVQVTFNVGEGLQVSNSLPVPANPAKAFCQRVQECPEPSPPSSTAEHKAPDHTHC